MNYAQAGWAKLGLGMRQAKFKAIRLCAEEQGANPFS